MKRLLFTVLIVLSAHLLFNGAHKEVSAETIIHSYSSESSGNYQDQLDKKAKSSIGNFSVLCELNNKQRALSKAILLDVRSQSAKDFDYLLTTAHGILDQQARLEQNCFVADYKGRSYELKAAIFADRYKAGTPSDWAIIKVRKIKSEGAIRYQLPNWDGFGSSSTEEFPLINFPKARGIPENSQVCHALPISYISNHKTLEGLFAHDCRSIPGQSGSPLSLNQDGNNVLLGIHLGTALTVYSPETGKPARYGYFRQIDEKLIEDIKTSIRILSE